MSFFANLNTEHARWFYWWPVGMAVGILVYFYLPFEPAFTPTLFVLFLSAGGLLYGFITRHPFYESSLRFFLYAIASVMFGFVLIKIKTNYLLTPMLKEPHQNLLLTGVIKEIEQMHYGKRNKSRVTLNLQGQGKFNEIDFPKNVRLNMKNGWAQGKPGDVVECLADILPVPIPTSLQGYDAQIHSYFAGIGAVGRIKGKYNLIKKDKSGILVQWRYLLTQLLRHKMVGAKGEVAAALVTGDRSGIPKDIRQNFTDAGIAHILAISGLHISLVAGLVFWATRRLFSFFPYIAERFFIKKWAAVISIVATGVYLAISGFGFPAQRAFIMTTLVMLGICFDRSPISLRSVAIAATFILLIFPESIISISFQLSFAAVIALIAAYENSYLSLQNWIAQGSRWRHSMANFLSIIVTTIVATVATTPLVISTFNRFTMQAILGNLLAIPLTSFWIMPIALLSMVILSLDQSNGILQKGIFSLWAYGIELLIKVAEMVSKLPGSAILIPTPHPFFLLWTLSGGLWLALWKQRWRYYGFIPIVFGVAFAFYDHHPDIYMAGDGSVIAYREGKTLYASSLKRGSFYVDVWARELGLTDIKKWPNPVVKKGELTLISDPYQIAKTDLEKLCGYGGLILSNGYMWTSCRYTGAKILDRYHLKKEGGYFVWIKKNSIKILSMKQYLGKRPWRND